MKFKDLEDRVRRIQWPTPSTELRDRVLSGIPVATHSVTWSDRVWFSRAWRLSTAAVALGLLALQVRWNPSDTASTVSSGPALVDARAVEMTSLEAGLPADVAASLARRVLTHSRSPAADRAVWLELQTFRGGDSGR